ncbi:MAG TPA: MFS transporter [Syntrophales bacterium]|nr:MFS transporter [Syntrophales bacterium]
METDGDAAVSNPSFSRRDQVLLLSLLTGIFLVNFICRVVLAPLMPVIEKDLGLGHTGAGGFFMTIALGYAAGLIGAGFVSSRLTHRQTVAAAAAAVGAAFLVIAAARSLWMIHAGLFIVGIFSGFYLPSGLTTITSAIPSAHWGKAMAVHELAPTLAFLSSPLIVEGLLPFLSWREILALIGGVAVLLGMAFHRFGMGGDFRGEPPTFGNVRQMGAQSSFWIMALFFTLGITASIGTYSMMPLYLVAERGIDRGTANALLSLSRVPVLATALLSGWLTDRFGPKPIITAALLFSGAAAILLALLPGRLVLAMVFLQPILTVVFFTSGFTILARIVGPRARSLAVSMTILIAYLIGAGLIPTLLGAFGDAGAFGLAFILVGSVTMASALLVPRLQVPAADKPTSAPPQ